MSETTEAPRTPSAPAAAPVAATTPPHGHGARPPEPHGDDDVAKIAEALHVRTSDIEPYIGLRYLSKLFRLMAIVILLLLVAEVATGFYNQGTAAVPTLLAEVSRLVVLAGLLWGAGDLAILLIDVGHDVRAARILLGRQAAHREAPPVAPDAPRRERASR